MKVNKVEDPDAAESNDNDDDEMKKKKEKKKKVKRTNESRQTDRQADSGEESRRRHAGRINLLGGREASGRQENRLQRGE